MEQKMTVNGRAYTVLRLLGKGKGGYSYLVSDGQQQYVLKQIHLEPCDYYQFGDKLGAELHDYARLLKIGIRMPALLEVDEPNERILKEYIDGETAYEMILRDQLPPACPAQLREMCDMLYAANTNIDYFPTNFVWRNGLLYYIDFECNDYMPEWDLAHWGIRYWSKTPEFLQYAEEHP